MVSHLRRTWPRTQLAAQGGGHEIALDQPKATRLWDTLTIGDTMVRSAPVGPRASQKEVAHGGERILGE